MVGGSLVAARLRHLLIGERDGDVSTLGCLPAAGRIGDPMDSDLNALLILFDRYRRDGAHRLCHPDNNRSPLAQCRFSTTAVVAWAGSSVPKATLESTTLAAAKARGWFPGSQE